MSHQNLYYYTNQLIEAKLIERSAEYGLEWKLTERGQFILKEFLSRSVNNNNTSTIEQHNTIPIRMHNVTFRFDILSTIDNDKNIRLRWIPINNGVSKCFIRYPDHTLELTKSPNENESVLEVHMSEVYTFDPYQGFLKQYDIARHYASLASQRLRLVISDNGRLVKKPHLAFERDLIALYLATFQTAETTTVEGGEGRRKDKAWTDSSKGSGELETNDVNYAYKYLMMPEIVMDIRKAINRIARQTAGYERYYHPIMSDNN
jgi:hypothetical protein